jgi:hypothetical protein
VIIVAAAHAIPPIFTVVVDEARVVSFWVTVVLIALSDFADWKILDVIDAKRIRHNDLSVNFFRLTTNACRVEVRVAPIGVFAINVDCRVTELRAALYFVCWSAA